MSNIVLVGMPGCGKSTVGVLLAKVLGYPFIDTDLIIQHEEKRLLQNIIDTDGIDAFLGIEGRIVSELRVSNHVIATGGSVIYSQEAMQNLKSDGLVVYLHLEYEEVFSRIRNIKSRGIAMEKGQTLLELYNKRIPLYEKYQDISIQCTGKNIEETVEAVMDRITKFCNDNGNKANIQLDI